MSNLDRRLATLIDGIGKDATEEQSERVVSFIIQNYPQSQWESAANKAIDVSNVYTDISERLGEGGIY